MEIKIPTVELIDRNKLIVDKTNPNTMSDRNFDALKEVMKKFGFLVPIITNKKYVIADGYHRWKASRELGIVNVPVIALDVDEVDRRILRQVMNKLKGQHREELDIEEYKYLDSNSATVELINYLPDYNKEIKGVLDSVDLGAINEHKEVDKLGHLQIKCPYCKESFKKKDSL